MYKTSPLRFWCLQLALPAVVTLLLLASCSRVVTDIPETNPIAVDFSLRIGTNSTRASGTQWSSGDALGVFMLKPGSVLQSSNIIDDAENLRYITTSSAEVVNLIPTDDTQLMYYPVDGSTVDFLAYYPYKATGTGTDNLNDYVYPIRVDNQTDASAIDLLYSRGSGNKNNKTVHLLFSHQLSKIRIVLRKSAGLSFLDLRGTRVVLEDMPLASGFSLSDRTFDYRNPSGREEIGVIETQSVTDGVLYEAFVLPQPADRFAGRHVGIALPASLPDAPVYAYEWYIPDGTVFRSGKEYTYTFTLHGNSVEFGGVEISDWEDYSFESTVIEMVDIPGGTFLMGSSDGSGAGLNTTVAELGRKSDETLHRVTLTDYLISRFPITNIQYAAYLNAVRVAADGMLNNNRLFAVPHPALTCITEMVDGQPVYRWQVAANKDNYPVTAVSWFGAHSFALWQGGDLPSEAQWEYACRGSEALRPGSSGGEAGNTAYSFGNEVSRLSKYAWYIDNNTSGGAHTSGPKEVGGRLMNSNSLYDIHGNVWEWCLDWYGEYAVPSGTNPVGTNPSSGRRALRGGAYDSPAADCRSASRHKDTPGQMDMHYGFRIVITK